APVLLGAVLGTGLQLQQPALWPAWPYLALAAGGAVGIAMFPSRRIAQRLALLLCAGALWGGLAGVRALAFAADGLQPELEGRDLVVTGIVAAMPQRNEAGVRFRFEVEHAGDGGQAVALPPLLQLGWYGAVEGGGQAPAALAPGERWRL